LDQINWVKTAISIKEKKYSSAQNLILIVWGEVGPLLNVDYAKKQFESIQSKFQAIYKVLLPQNFIDGFSGGQVIQIK